MSILKNKNLCILDIETTGFEPENSEIIEIFILKVSNSEIIDEFYSLFKPKDQINNSEIHGITDLKVKNAPLFKDKNDEIVDFIGDSVIIGHNLENFDLQFLNHYLNTELKNEFIDTLHLSRSVLGNKVANHKLNTLAIYFDVNPPTHNARDDVMTTFEIYNKLLQYNSLVSNIFFQTDSLTLGYGNEIVINELKLSLDKTKSYEIIGKNGAGKTTLLNFISNNFGGNSFNSKYKKEELDILEISHTPTLLPNLTLSENAIYFTSSKSIDTEIIESAIEKYNLGSYKTDELKNFSSGMIKRAELAIAEMKEPHILCIDEPLNYLDKQGINHLQTLINERAQNSKSNILSSQETSGLLKNKETINLDEI